MGRVNWWLLGVAFGMLLLGVFMVGKVKGWFVSVVWGNVLILLFILIGGCVLGFVINLFLNKRVNGNGLGNGVEGADIVSQRRALKILRYCFIEEFMPSVRDFGVPKKQWVRKDKPPVIMKPDCDMDFTNVKSHSDDSTGKKILTFQVYFSGSRGGLWDGYNVVNATIDEGEDFLWDNFYGFFEQNTSVGFGHMDKKGYNMFTPRSERLKYASMFAKGELDLNDIKAIENLIPKDSVVGSGSKGEKKDDKKKDDKKKDDKKSGDDSSSVGGSAMDDLNRDIELARAKNKVRDGGVGSVEEVE